MTLCLKELLIFLSLETIITTQGLTTILEHHTTALISTIGVSLLGHHIIGRTFHKISKKKYPSNPLVKASHNLRYTAIKTCKIIIKAGKNRIL